MAGRNYPPPLRHPPNGPRHAQSGRPLQVTALEERIAAQHREIQTLLVDNQRLAATHMILKQDLAVAQQELRRISAASGEVKAKKDAEVREVYERSLKLEAEVRAIDAMKKELAQVRADVVELGAERKELEAALQAADTELESTRANSKQAVAMKDDIEALHQEIQKGRMAIELEKKTQRSNLEHREVMERNMDALVHEIEKLRCELIIAETRSRASAAVATAQTSADPVRSLSYGDSDVGSGGSPFPGPNAMQQSRSGGSGAS